MSYGQQQEQPLNVPGDMLGYIPTIAKEMFRQVQQNGERNPVRSFQFRELSQGGGRNASMDALITFTAELLKLNSLKNLIRDDPGGWNSDLTNAVNFALLAHCAAIIDRNQNMANNMPQDAYNQIRNAGNLYRATMNEIQDMRQQLGSGGQQTTAFGDYNRGGNYTSGNNGYGGNFTNAGGGGGSYRATPSRAAAAAAVGGSSNVFVHGSAGAPQPTDAPVANNESRMDRANRLIAEATGRAPRHAPQATQQSQPAAPAPVVITPDVVWRPTPEEMYVPAVNTITEKLEAQVVNNQIVYTVAQVRKEEMDFNRDAHRLTSTAEKATSFAPVGAVTRGAAFEDSMKQLARAQAAVAQVENPKENKTEVAEAIQKYTQLFTPQETEATSLSALIFTARYLAKTELGDLAEEVAFRMNGTVAKDIVLVTDMDEFVQEIRDCRGFSEVLDAMHIELDQSAGTKDTTGFVAKLDTYITHRLNHFIRYNLGILTLAVESFMSDFNELVEVLRKGHGERYVQGLYDAEQSFITTYLQFRRSDEYVVTDVGNGDQQAAKHQPIVYSAKVPTSITVLGLYAKELNLETIPNQPCYLRKEVNPALQAYVTEVLDANKGSLMNHFLVTTDDVLYELTLGAAGVDYYLVTRISQR